MLLVKGDKFCLINISQLCNQNLLIKFTKESEVMDHSNKQVMEGARTFDKFYKVNNMVKCHKVANDGKEIWHKKLGHVNYRCFKRMVRHGTI